MAAQEKAPADAEPTLGIATFKILRMTCKRVRKELSVTPQQEPPRAMYVCNCNGIRERQVRAAIAAGATRPAQIFKACDSAAQCARCVCDMRKMLQDGREALRFAAE